MDRGAQWRNEAGVKIHPPRNVPMMIQDYLFAFRISTIIQQEPVLLAFLHCSALLVQHGLLRRAGE